MPVTVDAIKKLAISAIALKYGNELANAYGLLMFGGFGVPGLVDGATLAAQANADAAMDLTQDLALSLVTNAGEVGLRMILQQTAANALTAAGVSAEAVASMATLIVTGVFTPTPIASEPGPPSSATLPTTTTTPTGPPSAPPRGDRPPATPPSAPSPAAPAPASPQPTAPAPAPPPENQPSAPPISVTPAGPENPGGPPPGTGSTNPGPNPGGEGDGDGRGDEGGDGDGRGGEGGDGDGRGGD